MKLLRKGLFMKVKNDVEVLIDGKKYTISGFGSPEYIQKIATYINSKYAEFNKSEVFHRINMDYKSVMLAVNIADDYFEAVEDFNSTKTDNAKKDKLILSMKHEIIENRSAIKKLQDTNAELVKRVEEAEKTSVAYKVRGQDAFTKANGLEERLSIMQTDKGADKKSLEDAAKKIAELESVKMKLEATKAQLEHDIETLKNGKEKIASENKKLKTDKEKMKSAHKDEIEDIKTERDIIQLDLDDVMKERDELSKKVDDAQEKIKKLENDNTSTGTTNSRSRKKR